MATRIALSILVTLVMTAVIPLAYADEPISATTGPGGATVHKVEEGETLWSIAEKYYGDGKLWPKIWEANKDKLANAQSLKPGDELIIPPKEGEVPPPAGAPAETVEAPPAPAGELPAVPAEATQTMPAQRETPPAGVAAEAAAAVSSKTETSHALADDLDLYCSFFVADNLDDSVRLVASEHQDAKMAFDVDDLVFLNKGKNDGIVEGAEYLALDSAGHLHHPAQRQNLGNLYLMLGRVRVVCTFEKTSMAKITQDCFPMEIGSVLIPFNEAPVPIGNPKPTGQCDPPTGRSAGWIVYSQDQVLGLGEGHEVMIDLGSRDGVVPGDVFTIYRDDLARGQLIGASSYGKTSYGAGSVPGLPRWVLGNLVVVMTQEKTSTARIVTTAGDVRIGDKVELQ